MRRRFPTGNYVPISITAIVLVVASVCYLGGALAALRARAEFQRAVKANPHVTRWWQTPPVQALKQSARFRLRAAVILAAAAVIVALAARQTYRREKDSRRQRTPACASCGYNLTGNTSGYCPECGTMIERMR